MEKIKIMKKIDTAILEIDRVICKNISVFDNSERGLLSQNILGQLRNFIEHIALKAYSIHTNNPDIEISYPNIEQAKKYIKPKADFKFLNKFQNLLQISASHYTLDAENSERLMLKYYEYLLKIKSHLKHTYNLDVLNNIDDFPIDTDSTTKEYHEKIAQKIIQTRNKKPQSDRYYIQKVKPFFVNYEVYYEVTFTSATDYTSKFDRIIAFTKFDISTNYAVKLFISSEHIQVLGKDMPIDIIDGWEVSIRQCEFNNFADIFGDHPNIQSGSKEYKEMMKFLTITGLHLVELVTSTETYYQKIKSVVTKKAKVTHIFNILDQCREIVMSNSSGFNVIKYLLYRLNNKIIKQQYMFGRRGKYLSGLYLQWGCIPFDEMPFCTSLLGHNPKLSDLFDCIGSDDRECELLARLIKNNTETKGQLYTSKKEITGFENIDSLIELYNSNLYYKHTARKIDSYKNFLYIREYERDTIQIIEKLKELSSSGVDGYSNTIKTWLKSSDYSTEHIDCEDKKSSLKHMFKKSHVALIYGSAGTGKSTMINHISNFFNDSEKLYLANTNPAIDNLKRKVHSEHCDFKTIRKFLLERHSNTEFDLLIIDECSTVSNSDMLQVLNKASFKLLVLVGDVFQIESILFGNWFDISQSFIPDTSRYELTIPYRTRNPKLIDLWNKVRGMEDDILEHITRNDYSVRLDDSIFEHSGEDEIILCLNYDGLYGINNINKFLQSSNKNAPIKWGVQTYKIDDPVLFNETKRFGSSIYNNLKGKIVGIAVFEDKIQFDIEIDKAIEERDTILHDFILLDTNGDDKSIIRFFVNRYKSTDEDDDSSEAIVPFQIAYAVSIHKAQGLEYNSVKVVITDEVEEMITHNIFYTAITRAKEKLKIYWSPETEKKILENLEKRDNKRDVGLLKSKM